MFQSPTRSSGAVLHLSCERVNYCNDCKSWRQHNKHCPVYSVLSARPNVIREGFMFYPWCILFFSPRVLRYPSADRRETLPYDRKLGALYNASPKIWRQTHGQTDRQLIMAIPRSATLRAVKTLSLILVDACNATVMLIACPLSTSERCADCGRGYIRGPGSADFLADADGPRIRQRNTFADADHQRI